MVARWLTLPRLGFILNGSEADLGSPQVGSVVVFYIQELFIIVFNLTT